MNRAKALLICWLSQPQTGLALVALLLVYLLTGCAAVFDAPQPARREIRATVQFVDDDQLPAGVAGDAVVGPAGCLVRIRRSTYPMCITHELRHCAEGPFHGSQPSDADCYVSK